MNRSALGERKMASSFLVIIIISAHLLADQAPASGLLRFFIALGTCEIFHQAVRINLLFVHIKNPVYLDPKIPQEQSEENFL